MGIIFLDIETIPQPDGYESFLQAELDDFKAPSSLTKTQACADLGMTDAKEIKFTSKDSAIAQWEDKFKEEKAPEVADEKYRKTSFDGGKGNICSIAWGDQDNTWSVSLDTCEDEVIMINKFLNALPTRIDPFFIGHNIRFDLKFLFKRCIINQINHKGIFKPYGRHDKDFYCTQESWAGFKEIMSQDNLCNILGIEGKPDDIDGSKVWDHFKDGQIARIEEYNRYDVDTVRQIYNRLNFI